jgi:hypothetical protein
LVQVKIILANFLKVLGAGSVAHVIEHLHSKHKALSSNPSTTKITAVIRDGCGVIPATQEVEIGKIEV